MKILVPLAGPDFERADGSVKAEILLDGVPLLRRALEERPWWRKGQVSDADLVFVLRDGPVSGRFRRETLAAWYPHAKVVTISAGTQGAALTILAALALVGQAEEPICVDLADILYETDCDPIARFADEAGLGALALTFPSDNPAYSYLELEPGTDRALRAAEKVVISDNASAGTYLFARPAILLRAVAHALDNRASQTFRDLFFVCPLFNGVIDGGDTVRVVPVGGVQDIKTA